MITLAKICGIRAAPALDAAVEGGAAMVGFVLYPRSPRAVDLATAGRLAQKAREHGIGAVALLVDPDDALVRDVARTVRPDLVQLHGRESIARMREIRAIASCSIIKAVSVADPGEVAAAAAYFEPRRLADFILLDAKPPAREGSLPGGNGLSFDWRILEERPSYPFLLAGGLTPENVAEAIRLTRPALVDVSSGVETRPGEKSVAAIGRFLQAVKAANHTR